jgi:EpsI family protein
MVKAKSLIIIAIIFITILVSFYSPKIRYQSFDILEYINMPLSIGNWLGKELPNKDEEEKKAFTYINKSKQYYFWKKDGSEIYFSLLNAENFHDPKVCYTGIGYKPRYEGTHKINLSKSTTLQFDTYLMLKKNNTLLTTYWMCINGKNVNWLELKLNKRIYALTNKESINVLTRIDVPTNPKNTEKALAVTKDFLRDLYRILDKNKSVYVFGK